MYTHIIWDAAFFPSENKLTCHSNKSSGATGAITDDQITLFSFHSCGIVDADSLYHFNVTSLNTCAVFTVLWVCYVMPPVVML